MATNLNRAIGWALLMLGLAWAARVDAWSLGEPSLSSAGVAARILVRHSLAVLLVTGLLQLMVSRVIQLAPSAGQRLRPAAWLTGLGALAYAAGSITAFASPASRWLQPSGALLGLGGFLLLWRALSTLELPASLRRTAQVILPVICFGMALDVVMSAASASTGSSWAHFLGPADGLRLRMLRLGRVAAAALPMLAFLYEQAFQKIASASVAARIGRLGMLIGAVGMPLLLFLSASVAFDLKYLLTLPVAAVVIGTWIAAWLAWRAGKRFEAAGWLLTALSMGVGQWMGTFAFDGPLATPAFLGNYSDFPRQLVRAAHTYGVLLGMMGISAARELENAATPAWRHRLGAAAFAVGTVATLAVEALRISGAVPARILGFGPALVAAGLALIVFPLSVSAARSTQSK